MGDWVAADFMKNTYSLPIKLFKAISHDMSAGLIFFEHSV
jgi:hypothetical protein